MNAAESQQQKSSMARIFVLLPHLITLDAGDRKAMQALQMKDWLTQQMEENATKKQMALNDKK